MPPVLIVCDATTTVGSCAKLSNQSQVSNMPQARTPHFVNPFASYDPPQGQVWPEIRPLCSGLHTCTDMSAGCRTALCTTCWELEMAPTNTTTCCHHARTCSLLCILCKLKAMVLGDVFKHKQSLQPAIIGPTTAMVLDIHRPVFQDPPAGGEGQPHPTSRPPPPMDFESLANASYNT